MKKYLTISFAVALLLILANGLVFQKTNAANFSDVSSSHINKTAIEYLKSDKTIEGYSDGKYKPENRINRAEFIKIIVSNTVDSPTGSNCFTDVKEEWFAKYICTAKKIGYIEGYKDGTFKPSNYINFAEASKIITKARKITPDESGTNKEWFAGFVNSLAKKKAIPSTVHFFDKNITRGEMAEVIWRIDAKKTDKVSQEYVSITQEFPKIKSCAALKEKFDTYQGYNNYRYATGTFGFAGEDAVSESSAVQKSTAAPVAAGISSSSSSSSGGGGASEYSSTNIQVEGVDEADVIKNDGKYIYIVKSNTVRIVEAYPTSGMKEVGKIDFTAKNFTPSQMYVNGDQLVVIGSSWASYYSLGIPEPLSFAPRPWTGGKTKVIILNIKDRTNPTEDRVVTMDGNYNTSRRIGNQLYMVMNGSPSYWTMNEVKEGRDLIPYIQDGNDEAKAMVGCGDIHYFPGFVRPNYLMVASIPLNDSKGKINSKVLLGSSDNVYSSVNNLYVATNKVSYDYYTDWNWRTDRAKTLVYKFALNDGKIEYKNRGSVPGRILNQFSMDEHSNNFRIATTTNQWNSDKSSSGVYVLNKDMKQVGKIDEIAPGEKIYSTRFLGDRLYMVTFKQVDPLFVIDMKDPKAPKILGKLKIPGFSNYLHPYDANHIIGFGKDTEEAKWGTTTAGFKMALFDVSDVTNPKQKFVERIGDKGTYSELLNNHKALLFDKEKELLAFPIKIREKVVTEKLECTKKTYSSCTSPCSKRCIPTSCTKDESGKAVCTSDCDGLGSCIDPTYTAYADTFSGAVVYTLNSKTGFSLRGKITHYTQDALSKMGNYWPYDYKKNIQRIIYMGDNLYTIGQGAVKASDINTTKEIEMVELQ